LSDIANGNFVERRTMHQLTQSDLEQYSTDGFLLISDLIDPAALARYEDRFIEFALGAATAPAAMIIMRDVMVVKGAVDPKSPLHGVNKMINFEEDPTLYAYTLEKKLLNCVRDLIGEEIYSISTNVFNKPPDVDGRHPMHQDLRYFRIRPADKIVATWTALSRTTRENGCLAVVPGSHAGELREHGDPDWEYVNAGFYAIEDVDVKDRLHIEMQPGDTLLFHPLLIHGSGRNTSQSFRRAISSHYAAAVCESPVREWRQGKSVRPIAET